MKYSASPLKASQSRGKRGKGTEREGKGGQKKRRNRVEHIGPFKIHSHMTAKDMCIA